MTDSFFLFLGGLRQRLGANTQTSPMVRPLSWHHGLARSARRSNARTTRWDHSPARSARRSNAQARSTRYHHTASNARESTTSAGCSWGPARSFPSCWWPTSTTSLRRDTLVAATFGRGVFVLRNAKRPLCTIVTIHVVAPRENTDIFNSQRGMTLPEREPLQTKYHTDKSSTRDTP